MGFVTWKCTKSFDCYKKVSNKDVKPKDEYEITTHTEHDILNTVTTI